MQYMSQLGNPYAVYRMGHSHVAPNRGVEIPCFQIAANRLEIDGNVNRVRLIRHFRPPML